MNSKQIDYSSVTEPELFAVLNILGFAFEFAMVAMALRLGDEGPAAIETVKLRTFEYLKANRSPDGLSYESEATAMAVAIGSIGHLCAGAADAVQKNSLGI